MKCTYNNTAWYTVEHMTSPKHYLMVFPLGNHYLKNYYGVHIKHRYLIPL